MNYVVDDISNNGNIHLSIIGNILNFDFIFQS